MNSPSHSPATTREPCDSWCRSQICLTHGCLSAKETAPSAASENAAIVVCNTHGFAGPGYCPTCAGSSAPSAGAPTESRTDEQLIYWLEQKHKRHMELCDHLAAERLRELTSAPSSARFATTNIERAYCKANDYINALLTPSVSKESLKKIRADYLAAVRDVMTCEGCRDRQEGCPTPDECAAVRRSYTESATALTTPPADCTLEEWRRCEQMDCYLNNRCMANRTDREANK